MWNSHVPYALKYYIDAVAQPGHLFEHDESGAPARLCHNKKVVRVSTRGGAHSPGGPLATYDLPAEPGSRCRSPRPESGPRGSGGGGDRVPQPTSGRMVKRGSAGQDGDQTASPADHRGCPDEP